MLRLCDAYSIDTPCDALSIFAAAAAAALLRNVMCVGARPFDVFFFFYIFS